MKNDEYTIVRYKTFSKAMTACFGPRQIIHAWDGDGPYEMTRKQFMSARRHAKCWGFANFDTKTIHLWVGYGCTRDHLISLLAHELGHMERPRPRDKQKEEAKAITFARVALTAHKMMVELLEGGGNDPQ